MGKKNKNKDENTEASNDDMLTLDPSLDNSMENLTSEDGVIGNQAAEQMEGEGEKKEEVGEEATEPSTQDTPGLSTQEEKGADDAEKGEDKPLEALAPEAPTFATEGEQKAADEDVKAEAGEGEGEEAELGAVHEEAQPVVDAAPGPLDELKQAANIAGPALKKLGDFSDAIDKLEDEARARFDFARQKMTEAVAALENIYKRD